MSAPYDRPTNEPGGCECFSCGVIFIGAEWHTKCAVCAERERGEHLSTRQAPIEGSGK